MNDNSRYNADVESHRHRIDFGLFCELMFTAGFVYAVTAAIAFGSGAVLTSITGVNFKFTDLIVTIVIPPIILTLIHFELKRPGIRARFFAARVRRQGRYQPWDTLLPQLETGRGTLIIEIIGFHPTFGIECRAWWTPDRVLELAPGVPPENTYERGIGDDPFVDWVFREYTSRQSGSAALTEPAIPVPRGHFIDTPISSLAVPFKEKFPGLAVIILPALIKR
ncbi:MAG TPA: hypothetical protein VFE47_27250 [Tepidisphaeraceae bacterium]|jgi:hypothetical protein|nr:hypothetical protein [Tepidisphaeraceae bacterium]